MTLPIERLIDAAYKRGLTESNIVLLSMDSPQGQRVNISVSVIEPTEIVAPMDLIWISPSTKNALRRVSRAQSVMDFTHTWNIADETTFWEAQVWDEPRPTDQDFQELDRNIGNTHLLIAEDIGVISDRGAQMLGAFRPRLLGEAPDDYAMEEAVPRSFIQRVTDTALAASSSVRQQLASIRASLTNARNRLVIVEDKLQDIQIGEGTPRYKHEQIEETLEWTVVHSLNSTDVMVEVRNSEGVLMIPDEQRPIDANNILITFAEPRVGFAYVVGIR